MERFAKFGAVLVGLGYVKKSSDYTTKMFGIFLMSLPITYEMAPKVKAWCAKRNQLQKQHAEGRKTQDPEARVAAILGDPSLERTTVTFQSGSIGCAVTPYGIVDKVVEGSQAAEVGVQVGWHVLEVGDERPGKVSETRDLLKKHRGGFEPYTATFLTDSKVVEANVAALAQWNLEKEAAEKAGGSEGASAWEGEREEGDVADGHDGLRRRKADCQEEEQETSVS